MCFTAPHIYFPVVVICFFPADAIFHETRQHNWVPSHFISVPCQGASEHDINIHLFLYSCTVQPSLLSEMLTLHWAFWIMKSSCHASGWLWSYLSTLLKDKTVHKTSQKSCFSHTEIWSMLFRQSDVLSLNVIHETDSSESKCSFSRQWNLLLLLFQQQKNLKW